VGAQIKFDSSSPEQPILWLGMSGFAPQQRAVLEASLERPPGLPRWRTCRFGDADAWLVNGSRIRILPSGNLKVSPGLPTEQSVKLNLTEVDRPVAFATPLASTEFEPRCAFDPAARASVHGVLLQFETWLRLVRAQFVLGSQIIRLGAQLRHGIYHVSHRGNLLAVLDFREGKAGVSPRAHPADMREAQWDKRPAGARDVPESFVPTSPAQLAWTYVRRADRDALPVRYRSETIYFRGSPRVPMRWLRDSQLMLLRELSTEPCTLSSLRQRTGFASAQMDHDLTCLYYAGAITTTKTKAVRRVARFDSQPQSSGPGLESLLHGDADTQYLGDLTAPAQLEHKRSSPVQGNWAA
jgi:hypothetical protein